MYRRLYHLRLNQSHHRKSIGCSQWFDLLINNNTFVTSRVLNNNCDGINRFFFCINYLVEFYLNLPHSTSRIILLRSCRKFQPKRKVPYLIGLRSNHFYHMYKKFSGQWSYHFPFAFYEDPGLVYIFSVLLNR